MSYNPIPPRVWSRVQNQCTYTDASGNFDINYNQVYIPLTKQTVTQAKANYEDKLIYKGNILQYKGNSSRLTKSQKYTQLAKGFGPNRTKVFATQSQTYTNPNTTGLRRRHTQTYPYPNSIVGDPNNPSGPFQYNVPNPNGCLNNSIQDGGTLVCGIFANPCTGDIIKQGATSATICNPASASDVPGSSILCWNTQVQTWFPKPRYFMNNSTDKWPVNYKGLDGFSGLVSALTPDAPVLTLDASFNTSVTLSWDVSNNNCIPISSFNIYQNSLLINTLPYTIKSTTIGGLNCTNKFYVTSISNMYESLPSNIITKLNIPLTPYINLTAQNGSVYIYWSPLSNDCLIQYYNVYYSTDNSNFTKINVGNVLNYTITGLTNGVTYYVYVTAVNTIGESVKSDTVSAIPNTVPDAPSGLTLTVSNSTIISNWTAPFNGGSNIINYNLYYSTNNSNFTKINVGNVLTYTLNNLSFEFIYYIYVTAENIDGEGAPSLTSSISLYTIPGPPTSVIVSIGAYGNTATINWIPPQNTGGGISHYTVISDTGGLTNTSSGTSCIISGLTYGTSYTFTATSTNPAGTSSSSSASNVVSPTIVPGPPQNLSHAPDEIMRFQVYWNPPSYSGDSPLSHYILTVTEGQNPGGNNVYTNNNYTSTSFDSNIIPGGNIEDYYIVYVTSVNTNSYQSSTVNITVYAQGP